MSAGGVNLVLAFGAQTWRDVAPASVPAGLSEFESIVGVDGLSVPAAQHDVWMWISGSRDDVTWDHARAAAAAVREVADLTAEQRAFAYRDGHDMTGFVDGTANPPVRRAAEVALVQPGEPGAGGSHVLAMRWVHDLRAFDALPVREQERVIGRTKATDEEMTGDRLPPRAHIARVQIRDGSRELPIYRRSVPYGDVTEHGLCFVAFSADRSRYDAMLSRMFGTSGDGLHDRLTEFSRPVSAAYYFAPSQTDLNDVGGPEPE